MLSSFSEVSEISSMEALQAPQIPLIPAGASLTSHCIPQGVATLQIIHDALVQFRQNISP